MTDGGNQNEADGNHAIKVLGELGFDAPNCKGSLVTGTRIAVHREDLKEHGRPICVGPHQIEEDWFILSGSW